MRIVFEAIILTFHFAVLNLRFWFYFTVELGDDVTFRLPKLILFGERAEIKETQRSSKKIT